MLKHYKPIIIVFVAFTVLCVFLQFGVNVNYNMVDYLPKESPSTKALDVLEDEFGGSLTNARVCVTDVTIQEALDYKEKLKAIDGLSGIMWLDDVLDLKKPLETADQDTVNSYYKDGSAVISVTIRRSEEVRILNDIRDIMGKERTLISGDAVNAANSQEVALSETTNIFLILAPVIIIILILTTTSWFEPVLFLIAIGVSILINMGTNFFFGEVSFITQSVGPILQLAVSLDYAVFLLNSFSKCREQTDNVQEAMTMAMKRSFPAVAASAITTIFGFLALVFMRFKIGSDLGIVLAKGIVFSLISVMVFLPAVTVACYKIIDKTKHKRLIPEFKGLGKAVAKVRIPVIILIAILIIPSYLAQMNNSFTYGAGDLGGDSKVGQDAAKIDEIFGKSNVIVLMVPKGDMNKESELVEKLENVNNVTSVISYVNMVGKEIPSEFMTDDVLSQFYSEHYSRIILYTDTDIEGDIAFAAVKNVRDLSREYYGDEALTCGESVSLYDMRDVVTADTNLVTWLAIIAIGLVILFTFKSLSMPIILLLTIETSIWINLSITYFTGSTLCYIGFLIISTVQLGATVDYAILFTDHYFLNRKELQPKDAAIKTIQDTAASILTSGIILTMAGVVIFLVSSNHIVSQLGLLLGRGAALSVVMVLFFLPALMTFLDKVVSKTTLGLKFANLIKKDKKENDNK